MSNGAKLYRGGSFMQQSYKATDGASLWSVVAVSCNRKHAGGSFQDVTGGMFLNPGKSLIL